MADRLRDDATSKAVLLVVLRAMAQSGLKEAPRAWVEGLARVLEGRDIDVLRQAVATARALPASKGRGGPLGAALQKVASDATAPAAVRLDALAAVPGGLDAVAPDVFAFLRAQVDPDRPAPARVAAADVLAKAKLDPAQLSALTGAIRTAGPLEIDRLLSAFEQTGDEAIGLSLVSALEAAPARSSLRIESIKARLARFPATVRRAAEGLYATLAAEAEGRSARLEELGATLPAGDARRGQALFNGSKAACATCHAIGYLGGRLGPDLTKIGQVRAERDLLEAIAFPSASFARGYEPAVVATRDGKILAGLLREDAPDEVVIATSAADEARVARGDIEEIRPGTVSLMPAGLDRILTPRELADLVAFLKACR